MADNSFSPLVSCQWLQDKMTSGQIDGLVILDVSWSSKKNCQEEFAKRRIPGARYLNVMVGPHTELFPRNLPPHEVFQEAARAAGVNEDSHVILYSDTDNYGFFMSGRAWWTFTIYGAQKVSILNGGLQRWTGLGNSTTDEKTDVKTGNFTARIKAEYRLTFEDMEQKVRSEDVVLLDSRPPTSFKDGHLPEARNLPFAQLVDSERQEMKSSQQLKELFQQAQVDLSKPVITYCNSGMSSSTLAFAYKLSGGSSFALYHGGFTEWKNRAQDQIEKS
ncbi:hypothetical protein ACOMHN_031025 [Nucella lapillus]